VDRREVLITTVTDATPDMRDSSPRPSIWPLISALLLAVAFIASIFTPWAVVWGGILVGIGLTCWFWPKGTPEDEE
jgi:cytochrome c oxidase subunit 1